MPKSRIAKCKCGECDDVVGVELRYETGSAFIYFACGHSQFYTLKFGVEVVKDLAEP